MKILRVKGRNLASIAGEFDIDFEDPRFVNAGVFAITGPTGSGKSTILDAISLALYDNTVRFSNMSRITITNLNGSDVGMQDPASIITIGENNCCAEIDFLNNKGEHCWARWSAILKNKKYTKNYEFKNFITNESYDTANQKNAAVIRAIGLDFAQFNQVVLLPQGEFSKFLKADAENRMQILEQITGLTIYKKISEKIAARKKAVDSDIEQQKNILNAMSLLSDEEIQELRINLENLTNEQNEVSEVISNIAKVSELELSIEKNEKDLEQKINNEEIILNKSGITDIKKILNEYTEYLPFKSKYDAILSLRKGNQDLEKKQNELNIEIEKAELEEAKTAKELAQALEKKESSSQKKDNSNEAITKASVIDATLEKAKEDLAKLDNDYKQKKSKYDVYQSEEKDIKQFIDAAEKLKAKALEDKQTNAEAGFFASNWNYIQNYLSKYDKAIANQKILLEKKNTNEKLNVDLNAREAKILQDNEKINHELEELNQQKQENQLVLNTFDKNDLFNQHISLVNLLTNCENANKGIAQICNLIAELETNKSKQKECLEELKNNKKEIELGLEEYKSNLVEIEKLNSAISEANLLMSLEEQRRKLQDGKPCPLCGSIHHPLKDFIPDENATTQQEKNYKALTKHNQELDQRIQAQNQLVTRLEAVISSCDDNINAKTGNLEILASEVNKYLEELNLESEKSISSNKWLEINKVVEAKKSEIIIKVQNVKKHIVDTEAASKKEKELSEAIDNQNNKLFENIKSLAQLKEERAGYKLDVIESNIALNKAEIESCEKDIEDSIQNKLNWRLELSKNGISGIDSKISKGIQIFNTACAQITKCEQEIAEYKAKQEVTQQGIATLELDLLKLQKELQEKTAEKDKLTDDRSKLLEGMSVEAFKAKIDEQVSLAIENYNRTNQKYTEAVKSLENKKTEKRVKQDQLKERLEQLSTAESEFKKIAECKLQTTVEYISGIYSLSEALIADYQTTIKDYETSCKQARELVTTAQGVLEKAKNDLALLMQNFAEEYIVDNRLAEAFISTTNRRKQELAGQIDDLKASLKIQEANTYKTKEITKTIEEIVNNNEALFELAKMIGSKDGGNNFNRFAQAITFDYLLAGANKYLRQLMPRYELKKGVTRGTKENLQVIIIDHENVDNERLVSLISGGETFVISLSLALALSDITCKSSKIESLFIDEGFGTLDPENLEVVMSTLENLNKKGGTIGIITHVEGVAARVQTRISLERLQDKPTRSKVVIYPN